MARDALAGPDPALDRPGRRHLTASAGAATASPAAGESTTARLRIALAGIGAAVVGVAPHVLHHAGPLAGAALLGGAGGRTLFGLLGFAAAIPMLRGMRRRTRSWRAPAAVLGVMAGVFLLSSFALGPAITGSGDDARAKDVPARTAPAPAPGRHDDHH